MMVPRFSQVRHHAKPRPFLKRARVLVVVGTNAGGEPIIQVLTLRRVRLLVRTRTMRPTTLVAVGVDKLFPSTVVSHVLEGNLGTATANFRNLCIYTLVRL